MGDYNWYGDWLEHNREMGIHVRYIKELEAALKVFTDIMEEGGCVDCPFWEFYDNGGGSYCGYDRDPKPCKMGWRGWAIEEGKKFMQTDVEVLS